MTDIEAQLLDLLAKVGIRVTRTEASISDEVRAVTCDVDVPGEHGTHADALVLWFEDMADVEALQELTYLGEYEFGCNWPSVYGPDAIIQAVRREDIPDLIGLLRKELAGAFVITDDERRRLRPLKVLRALALVTVLLGAFNVLVQHSLWGLVTVALGLGCFEVWNWRIDRAIPPRGSLDAARARQAVTS